MSCRCCNIYKTLSSFHMRPYMENAQCLVDAIEVAQCLEDVVVSTRH